MVSVSEEESIAEWRSSAVPLHRYEVYERDHHITQEVWGGYARHNVIGRKVFNREGNLISAL
ncbi:hypothetical protein J14TS5_45270 [Paenibacillus lautus]|uniref:hypothetical protein n=1 Tax=Paenibacillus lautus TaxID=1401 RepID=UPI001B1BBB26|nr:hypothetical protein [Paenibacillus lautus]GIO99441.1 hypothetical protein J14TS5_45270 [Paenibacillus lautus]